MAVQKEKHMRPDGQSAGSFESIGLSAMPVAQESHKGLSGLEAIPPRHSDLPFATVVAENRDLAAEVLRLRAERERSNEQLRRIMEILGCKSPDRIVHDLRNVLNERELFRSLADLD